MVIYHFLIYICKFLLENFIVIIVINDGLFFRILEASFDSQRILWQLSLVLCKVCDSNREIVVENLATSSLVSSSFIGCEVDAGREKAVAD